MKTNLMMVVMIFSSFMATAQVANDTTAGGSSIIIKDSRIDVLGKKMAEHNASIATTSSTKTVTQTSSSGIVLTNGYRLMVISTNDRDLAMKVRAQLNQSFPEHKQIMSFQMPNTKIKLGNFIERAQAEKVRKQIMAMKLVTNNIYIVSEIVEMKVEKKDPNAKEDTKEDKKDSAKKK
jgi:SPOR domain